MGGSILLTTVAALRVGAGLVTAAVPESVQPQVALGEPAIMTVPMPETRGGCLRLGAWAYSEPLLAKATAVAIGPGLRSAATTRRLVERFFAECPLPLVVDADGLNALVPLRRGDAPTSGGPRILTPHPGEFARLVGAKLSLDEAQAAAVELATERGVILVLKSHATLVTDGASQYVCPTGNPGLATGGSGDVLTGVIAGLLAQGLAPRAAAELGVFLHGRAGDMAAERVGQPGLLASDLWETLPLAVAECQDA